MPIKKRNYFIQFTKKPKFQARLVKAYDEKDPSEFAYSYVFRFLFFFLYYYLDPPPAFSVGIFKEELL